MCIGIVTPTENACIWNAGWEKIAEPIDAVLCRPCVFSMSIKTVDSDNAMDVIALIRKQR